MLEKPVIIMGGGLWGSLLAIRLKQQLPQVRFKLYEPSSVLGEGLSTSFHHSDLSAEAQKWLKPFITQQWKKYDVDFPHFHKTIEDSFCTIHSLEFNQKVKAILGDQLELNSDMEIEDALKEGAFVIDTRNNGYFKAQGYQKTLSLLVRVKGIHFLTSPLVVDATVEQKNGFRYLQYLPLDESTILVKDTRCSTDPGLYQEYFEQDILTDMQVRGYEPLEVINREQEFKKIPVDQQVPETSNRIIRLEGLYHASTGDILPDAVRIIDRMVKTSFRYGELKELLKTYQSERESKIRMLKTLNRFLYQNALPCQGRYQFMQLLYQVPQTIRQKFYAGELEMLDVVKSLVGRPIVPVFRLMSQFLALPIRSRA